MTDIQTMLSLLRWVENEGPVYYDEAKFHYPATMDYGLSKGWIMVMSNKVVRATMWGGRLLELSNADEA